MKKLLTICFMIVALLGIFAISALAEEIVVSKTENTDYGTVIQLNADPGLDNAAQYVSTLAKIEDAGTDTNALCILTDGNADNPSYYVFPSSYIVDERDDGKFDLIATQLATAMADFNSANGTNYYAAYETTGSGGAKRINALVGFVFPSSVLSASQSVCCMRECPNLREIKINHAIDFSAAEKMFYRNSKLASVVGFELVDGTKLPKTMFASCSSLRYIKLPTNTTKIPGSFFQSAAGVVVVNMEELTQLTVIDSWAFDGTQNLVITLPDSVTTINTSAFESAFKTGGSITINPTSQLATIGNNAFSGSSKLTTFYIPSTVTSIGKNAFKNCGASVFENFENCKITTITTSVFEAAPNFTTIKIPETVTTIESYAFVGNRSLKTVYIPTSVTTIAENCFAKSTWVEAPTNLVIYYIGKDASKLSDCTAIAGATPIPAKEYDPSTAYTGFTLVLGYSHCIAYNNSVHSAPVTDIIVKSYLETIEIFTCCSECGIGDTVGEIAPLFTCYGFSAPENGDGGIVIGFAANNQAINEYETLSEKKISFGVFVVSEARLGDNDIFDKNGDFTEGVIGLDMTDRSFAMFDLKVTGFTDEQKDMKLAMGTYVATVDTDTTEYSYLQDKAPEQGDKYYFASFNEIMEILG